MDRWISSNLLFVDKGAGSRVVTPPCERAFGDGSKGNPVARQPAPGLAEVEIGPTKAAERSRDVDHKPDGQLVDVYLVPLSRLIGGCPGHQFANRRRRSGTAIGRAAGLVSREME